MTPREWRIAQGFSLADMASLFNVGGRNPRSSYRRYEVGLSRCPLAIVVELEKFSQGAVTAADWLQVQQAPEKLEEVA